MERVKYALAILAISVSFSSMASAQEVSKRDQIHMAVQEICPVSGQKLDHGTAIKVRIGQENIFLHCKGCLNGKVNPQHWATIHGNFAKAQRICPVMKHELPDNPKWTIVEGQIVYVCCPPCTEKISKAPAGFLKQIDDLYLASLQARQATR